VALQGVDAQPLLRRTCPADQDEEALGRGLLGSTRLDSVDSRVQTSESIICISRR
jgi:hypothetical protein